MLGREAVGVCVERATATATATGQRAGVWDEEEAIVMVFVGHLWWATRKVCASRRHCVW